MASDICQKSFHIQLSVRLIIDYCFCYFLWHWFSEKLILYFGGMWSLMLAHARAHMLAILHFTALTLQPRHISAVKAAMRDYKKRNYPAVSSNFSLLSWPWHTHTWCVCTTSVIWQGRWCLRGLQPQMCYFICAWVCVYVLCSFVSCYSPEIWLFIYSFHLVCLLYVCVSYYIARRPIVIIADPDMLRQVMVKEFNKFPNRMVSGITFTN